MMVSSFYSDEIIQNSIQYTYNDMNSLGLPRDIFIKKIRTCNFENIIDLNAKFSRFGAFLCFLSNSKVRMGFNYDNSKKYYNVILDLCGVSYIKEYTNLPIILDTSHAMGYSYGVPDLTRACVAMGIDGLLIESHPNPKIAKSDAAQQLDFNEFKNMFNSLKPIAKAVGKDII